ncbi:hypothetical protein RHGRI_035370 [Rhododendron griersonianum]|uniref:Uncharacterized protein n=1 Tax=Rhododendron griersonianum TaxID=479676 RepID=A0AAV6I4D1_9ERIC|nr:hypothetical protein RHGRI_035370 [Rhododendron griersonianum]
MINYQSKDRGLTIWTTKINPEHRRTSRKIKKGIQPYLWTSNLSLCFQLKPDQSAAVERGRETGDTAVDFFLETLKNLIMSSDLDVIIDEKHQLQSLAEEIKYLRGFLKITEKKRKEHYGEVFICFFAYA